MSFSEDSQITPSIAPDQPISLISPPHSHHLPKSRYFDTCELCGEAHSSLRCPLRTQLKCYLCGDPHPIYKCPISFYCPICGFGRRSCCCGYPQSISSLRAYAGTCWKCDSNHSALICPQRSSRVCSACGGSHDFRGCGKKSIQGLVEVGVRDAERLIREGRKQEWGSRFGGNRNQQQEQQRRISAQKAYRQPQKAGGGAGGGQYGPQKVQMKQPEKAERAENGQKSVKIAVTQREATNNFEKYIQQQKKNQNK